MRRAGRRRLAADATLIWSLAEGRRGRRWRTVVAAGDTILQALLLELDRDGRPTRLELATAAGMLTLHPEADGSAIHGNVVGQAGVSPLAFAWSPATELEIARAPLGAAVAARRLAGRVPIGGAVEIPVLAIDADLGVSEGRRVLRRLSASGWRLEGSGDERPASVFTLDSDGVPAALVEAGDVRRAGQPPAAIAAEGDADWPLEPEARTRPGPLPARPA